MNWARFPFDLANYFYAAVVAEWLRRLTRNQIPSGSAGSNPADCENFYFRIYKRNNDLYINCSLTFHQSYRLTFLSNHVSLTIIGACQHRWFSGRMLACHAGGPGSIPGRCMQTFFQLSVYFIIIIFFAFQDSTDVTRIFELYCSAS